MKLQIVPARRGAAWVKLGIQTFFKQPMALGWLFFIFLVVVTILSIVPLIGFVLGSLLIPAMTLGIMVGSQRASQGAAVTPLVLFSSFLAGPKKLRAMLLLGVYCVASFALSLGISALVDGGTWASIYLGNQATTATEFNSEAVLIAMWLFISLQLMLSLLFWYAPALIYWQDVPVIKAMFFSFVACLRNFRAMLVFSLLWLAIMFGVAMLAGLLVFIAGAKLGTTLVAVGMLLLAVLYFNSLYFTYLDCFTTPDTNDNTTPD